MKFSDVTQSFARLQNLPGRIDMTKELASLLSQANSEDARLISYMSLGQLRAQYLPTQFNLAEKMMIPVIASVLGRDEKNVKAQAKEFGDLSEVIKQGHWEVENQLTLKEIHDRLTYIEKISGEGSQEEKISELVKLLKEVTPLSASFIVRIVLGKLRLGFSDMTLLDALSWMEVGDKSLHDILEHGYNISADIGHIAYELKKEGIEGVKKLAITVGVPVRPAAAERLTTPQAIFEKLGPCVAQPKIDGFRLQVHLEKEGDEVKKLKFYSRNLIDMSHMFPDLAEEISKLPVKSFIAEGEAIVYDDETDSYLPFQLTVKRKRKHAIESAAEEYPLHLFIFDILYLDGQPMLDKGHEVRRKIAVDLFQRLDSDKVDVIEEKQIKSADELEKYFIHALETGLEGLVIKRPDAIYRPGKRNFNWIKLKKSQEGELIDTVDCVVLGYYAGKGRRADFGIGAFLVGIYNKDKDRFETIAKIGTGLSDEGWREIKKRCDEIKVIDKPVNVMCTKDLYPDVWVRPEIVCLVAADEITRSPLHTALKTENELGYALRFPRILEYRFDKSATDATSGKEIEELYGLQYKK